MSFYIVDSSSNQKGPYSEQDLRSYAASGHINGETLVWKEGMADWKPLKEVLTDIQGPMSSIQPPPSHVGQSFSNSTLIIEVIKKEYYQMPKIVLNNQEAIVEAGQMHYMIGDIEIEAEMPSVGGFIKSKLTKERAVRPRYRGTGEIFLEPTYGECNIMELKGEEWILDKGCFLACEPTVTVGMYTNKAMSGFFGGEGFFQTSVSGTGKVLFGSQGPLETIHLNNDVLTVDGSFAVARTAGLEFKPEKATKNMFGSWMSGEGIVNRFRGTGTVLIAPFANRFLTMVREFGGIRWAIRNIPRGG